jgi:hypothetical protein
VSDADNRNLERWLGRDPSFHPGPDRTDPTGRRRAYWHDAMDERDRADGMSLAQAIQLKKKLDAERSPDADG